jgi:hypothetical protein
MVLAIAAPAHAAFPGQNGRIAFESNLDGNQDIYTIYPNVTNLVNLTNNPNSGEGTPTWSPDGTQVEFFGCGGVPYNCQPFVINSDGSGLANLPSAFGADFAWSPDGQRAAFTRPNLNSSSSDVWIMDLDGAHPRRITQRAECTYVDDPSWSPRGDKIAFVAGEITDCFTGEPGRGPQSIYTVNIDGSGLALLRGGAAPDWSPDGTKIVCECGFGISTMDDSGANLTFVTNGRAPAWSPDGTQIAFHRPEPSQGNVPNVYRINVDGTGETILLDSESFDQNPSWQPLPGSSPLPPYPAPKLASPIKMALIPVFKQCGTPGNPTTGSHSAPLSVGSCNPQPQGVAHFGAQAQGTAWIATIYGDTNAANGDQADMTLRFDLGDIRTAAGGDYDPNPAGADGTLVTRLRFTDRSNGPSGTDPGTATDFDFSVPFACTPTASTTVGSDCRLDTSADAVNSGMIKENKATVLQVFRLRLNDSGPNGVRGDGDDKLFASEGVFVP